MSAALAIAALQTIRIACSAVSRIPPKLVNKARKRDILMMIAAFIGSEALTSAFVVPVTLLSLYYGTPPGTLLSAVQYVFYVAQVYGLFESFGAKRPAIHSLQAFEESLQAVKVKSSNDAAATPTNALNTAWVHPDTNATFFLSALVGYFWVPRNVQVIRDIPYVSSQELVDSRCTEGASRKWLMLDVIRQKGHRGRPVLVYIHGGAWSHGDKQKRTMPTCYHFASHENWVVLNINYRLAPKFNLHDMVVDVKRAIVWAKRNAHVHGGDANFIAIAGGSAGAHLASIAALTPNWAEFKPGFEQLDTRVQACCPIYPPVNHVRTNQFWKSWFLQTVVQIPDDEYQKRHGKSIEDWCDPANILAQIGVEKRRESVPPFFIIHGEFDTLVQAQHVRDFVHDLRQGNTVPIGYLELTATHHGFDVAFSPKTQYANWAAGVALSQVYKLKQQRG